MTKIRISKGLTVDGRDITERFVRAAGPGGQNRRHEATAVALTLNVDASSLPADMKARLVTSTGRGVTGKGLLVVMSRAYRSQAQNRAAARARLIALLQRAARQPRQRRATRPDAQSRETRLTAKHVRAAVKRARAERETP
ncbi:MAG TPA: alternative ribosome rescue aminoacyl-tRNA hydrolase ArfB [Vicinamibacterales bacterium]|nr:alternative ribosome rescue aminoacyl-tRNA hydrolase ArfB [Vicinamibacterales bacterium]